ncbi:tryptophanase [Halobacterium salinarum]|uniref:Probable tryptophanase n=4 Tax=Halobacterium salinarum TaxID=2242 RepID=TNAA_HALSA|nr:tryptophanase [Halobacterium salinarum]B0R7Q6.1 RecName: Full=Probable tryptophanase; AltName: Full=L-tryptophan indole-lyase; Short=TNase [Halobacterium salinarum R1]Q9HMV2.2 RecName: Full=Probable tryptophanase; AltName: Full=L-tryptophan indole-lyase; Short=TNase [Halobacterium salinarum NRC-1]MBB6089600.1 tryptophanase [Halobacterium salinarum]MDL0120994.1 tryptophanase [Halobacterium salinarum]MDL0131644.1 tryptophanase [Halobacterium salinarum]UEB91823.1 tryptophanase [Halobacterium 
MRSHTATMVDRIEDTSRADREAALADAGHNVFELASDDVAVDLLTDSGTGTMSNDQWAAMLQGDEAYAGSASFEDLAVAAEDVMGFQHIIPAHQGRGAENVLYGAVLSAGDTVLNNAHFDTTRAHVAANDATPVDCPVDGARDPDTDAPFKGNFSVERARRVVDDVGADAVPVVVLTITNNSMAGQPVSIENTREVAAFADDIDATFVIDACRFAENAHFVQQREPGYEHDSVAAIAREQLSYADACVMSGKKDGLVNVGGFVGLHDDGRLHEQCRQRGILYEGFSTYGGMSGRDMAAFAVGLREAVEPPYVAERVAQVQRLADALTDRDVPIYQPAGGHAVYIDANAALPHLPREQFPGQAFVCELYREGGVRAVELGRFAFPDTDRRDLVRLALPRRTYGPDHLDHVADTAAAVCERGTDVTGLEIVSEPELTELRHFSAALQPVA